MTILYIKKKRTLNSMIKQLLKSKEEFVRDICSIEWLKLHAKSEARKRVENLLEEQRLALIQEIKVWAEKKKWKVPNYSLEDAYEGGKADDVEYVSSVESHNKILEDLLKELDSIKEK